MASEKGRIQFDEIHAKRKKKKSGKNEEVPIFQNFLSSVSFTSLFWQKGSSNGV